MFNVAMVTEKLVLDADNDCSDVMLILLCELQRYLVLKFNGVQSLFLKILQFQ